MNSRISYPYTEKRGLYRVDYTAGGEKHFAEIYAANAQEAIDRIADYRSAEYGDKPENATAQEMEV